MAGPLTIQRVPKGLLHALAMKGSGDLPTELAPQVGGSFELSKFYLLDNIRSLTSSSPAVGPDNYNAVTAFTVPPGELWIPINLTAQRLGGIGLGTNFTMGLGYARKFSNGAQAFPVTQVIGVDGDAFLSWQFDGEFMLTPGDNLGVWTFQGTYGANPSITTILDYYRLEI